MGQYLIDNNAVSSYFSGAFSKKAMDFMSEVIDQIPNISVITQIEALSWIHPNKAKEAIVKEFVNDAVIFDLTTDIVAKCIAIRRSKKIRTPDAIMAATAIIHNLTLITSDADFNNIPGLKTINPNQL